MRSPFAIFRKNQKTMMVVLVGLSMVGFVLLGAVQDPTNMPKALVFISVLAVCGGAAWIAGMSSGKSKEYGSLGLVIGALVAVLMTVMADQPSLAVLTNSGDLTVNQLSDLRNRREVANRFIAEALRQTREPREFQELAPKYTFSFLQPGLDEDVVAGELLRREADRLGIHISQQAVTDFIRKVTGDKISADSFKDIRTSLHVSEPELYDILADELQARMAAEFLYGYDPDAMHLLMRGLPPFDRALPPEEYWEFYRRMYVKQQIEVAEVPVKPFVDESAEPTAEQIRELFAEFGDNAPFDRYRATLPFQGVDHAIREGDPGFAQPRKVQVGYLEAVPADFRSGISPVTDEDIERYYQENYVKPAAEAAARRSQTTTPGPNLRDKLELQLPELPAPPSTEETPSSGDAGSEENPGDAAPATEPPASDEPAAEPASEESPSETPSADPQPEEAKPDSTAEDESPADKSGKASSDASATDADGGPGLFSVIDGEAEAAPTTEAPTDEKPADETPAESAETTPESTEPAATEPATTEPAAPESEPAADTPANAPESTDAPAEAPAETPPESNGAAAGDGANPAPPEPDVPLLDEALRNQIRTAIEDERTEELLKKAVEEAARAVDDQVGYQVSSAEDDPEHLTIEQATEILKQYAAEHSLHYAETGLLSGDELFNSEDHPVGAARDLDDPTGRPFAQVVFETGAKDTFRPIVVKNMVTQSWFVGWKIAEQRAYVPTSPDDEQIRNQIVAAWRELQAREKAKARAEELAARATASGQPLSTSLADTTVMGDEGGLFLAVKDIPEFSWLSSPGAMGPNPFALDPPEIEDPPGLENVYKDFMHIVFDELEPGEVGVAPNADRSIYYVVRVISRSPMPGDAGYDAFRERFLREPVFQGHPLFALQGIDYPSIYQQKGLRETLQLEPNWAQKPGGLFSRYDVEMIDLTPQEPQS